MHAATVLIPTHLNNGKPVPDVTMHLVRREAVIYFGGYTEHTTAEGAWCPDNGKVQLEGMIPFAVATDHLPDLYHFAKFVKTLLDQEKVAILWGHMTFV